MSSQEDLEQSFAMDSNQATRIQLTEEVRVSKERDPIVVDAALKDQTSEPIEQVEDSLSSHAKIDDKQLQSSTNQIPKAHSVLSDKPQSGHSSRL